MIWDPRLDPLGVRPTVTPGAVWHLVSAIFQDATESGGNHNIYYKLIDESGAPMPNIPVYMDWVGRNPREDPPTRVVTDFEGKANVGMYANLDPAKQNGPYFAYVTHTSISDIVTGMGLPSHHHVNFLLTFQHGKPTPNPTPDPTPTPDPWNTVWSEGIYRLQKREEK